MLKLGTHPQHCCVPRGKGGGENNTKQNADAGEPLPLADDPKGNVGGPKGSAADGHAEGAAELKAEDGGWGISGSNPTITIPFAMVRSPSHVRP